MSIRSIIEQYPEMKGLTMRYANGGMEQVFQLNGKEVRLGPMATDDEVIAAFKEQK